MKPWERWIFNALVLLVTASGVAYLIMKYGLRNEDPFSVVNHPLQPAALDLHILSAPFLMFMGGLLFATHARYKKKRGARQNRRSGDLMLWTFLVMSGSGYLLQITTAPTLHSISLAVHLAGSGLFVLSFSFHLAHSLVSRRRVKDRDGIQRMAA